MRARDGIYQVSAENRVFGEVYRIDAIRDYVPPLLAIVYAWLHRIRV